MERNIKTIPKKKMNGIKAMSPYQIDEIVLLGFGISNDNEKE